MASPSSRREVRVHVSSTFVTNHANAATDSWALTNSAIHKLRVTAADVTGLTQPGISDETLQTRFHTKPPNIAGLSKGSVKLTTYAGGAYANVDVGPEWNVARASLGGYAAVTNARSGTVSAQVSTTNIGMTSVNTYVVAGQAVLIGVKGDGRGNGEVHPINGVSPDHIQLSVATAAAAAVADPLVFCSSLYPDEDATQHYVDVVVAGHASADQFQTCGGVPKMMVEGLGLGEQPRLVFDIMSCDWRYVPTSERVTISHTTSPRGGEPSFDKAIGLAHIGDQGSSTRTAYKVTDVTYDPGIEYAEIPSPSGVNGVGGYQHMPGVGMLEMTVITAEDDGLIDDYPSTAKHIVVQAGHTATKTIAVEFTKAYLSDRPTRVEVNNLTGWRCKFFCTETYNASSDLVGAGQRIHVA